MYFNWPKFFRRLTPTMLWQVDNKECVYLTFDDGPTPKITEYILDTLDQYGAKATFFCLGNNAEMYPELIEEIERRGHAIGNHSYNHTRGWLVSTEEYMASAYKAGQFLPHTRLFRPAYGRIAIREVARMRSQGWRVVMWNSISEDYDHKISPQRCAQKVIRHLKGGNIIVFHDSVKASQNMMYALPKVLEAIKKRGLRTEIITKDL
jgi:peptidoglycan/xylan/chitin deacetylase (PgdA/CDA1 family)